MLSDFYKLMPELYGESSCTANAHLLSHLAKYVRLWGPLWTHSTFGFESKNGQLKHLFHGRTEIHHQLLFNIDVACTLQYIHVHLLQYESEETLNYLNHMHPTPKYSNCVGEHSYIIGQCKLITPTSTESSILGYARFIFAYSNMDILVVTKGLSMASATTVTAIIKWMMVASALGGLKCSAIHQNHVLSFENLNL